MKIEHKSSHKKHGQWCLKCHRYIGKIKKFKKLEPISAEDYLR